MYKERKSFPPFRGQGYGKAALTAVLDIARDRGYRTVWVKQGFGALQTPRSAAEMPTETVDTIGTMLGVFEKTE